MSSSSSWRPSWLWKKIIGRIRTRATITVVVGGGGCASTYLTYKYYHTDEGSRRAIQAYTTFVPVILHYRWYEFKSTYLHQNVTDDDWNYLDELYAIPTVTKLGQLQGMYTKYGQTAAGFTNTLGTAWIHELRKLEDQVPPRSVECIYQTIQEETGRSVDETFDYIDPIPLGSASIGQVHRAILKDTQSNNNSSSSKSKSREVAVKVQYPDAQRLFEGDMATIRSICEIFAPEQIVMLRALEQQNKTELDYRHEASNLLAVHTNMKRHGFLPRDVIVPLPISSMSSSSSSTSTSTSTSSSSQQNDDDDHDHDVDDDDPTTTRPSLTTSRMLVMELIPGVKLIDGVREYYRIWAQQHNTTLAELETEARKQIETHGIPAKYNGPTSTQMAFYRRYLQMRDKLHNAAIWMYNHTIGGIGDNSKVDYVTSVIPPNIPRIVDTLMTVHGYQLLQDGCFNCDPHGGNFILLPDGYRIGLIDYGSVKQLTYRERLSACLLYAALARNDQQMLFDMCDIGGYKSKYGRRDVLMKLLLFGYDSWGPDVMEGKNIQTFIDELKRQDPWTEVPSNLIMAQFLSIRLRSLALGMNHPVKCSDYWGPIAEQILRQEGHPYESWDRAKLVEYMPEMNMQKMNW